MHTITVVVPLDGSAASEQALPTARALAEAAHARIELIYVVDEHAFIEDTPALLIPDQCAAERYLRSTAKAWRFEHVTIKVLCGDPATELLELTSAASDTVIVMATHGRGSIGRLVFGSVTDKIVRGACVPVVAVRVAAGSADCDALGAALETITVPLDGSELAEAALPMATRLARGLGATLQLVRVIEPFWRTAGAMLAPDALCMGEARVADIEAHAETDARAYLMRLAATLRADDLRVVWETRYGRPADELARSIETSAAGLVVMVTHGRGGWRRWALGSVTSELLQHGAAPVMVVRPTTIDVKLATCDPRRTLASR